MTNADFGGHDELIDGCVYTCREELFSPASYLYIYIYSAGVAVYIIS